jgi:molecular chaperone DnaK (HSP70)
MDRKTREDYNSIIVPKNTTIPFDESKTYTTIKDNQTDVRFKVTMGEERDPKYCQELGEVIITDLPPMPEGEPSIKCTFRYDNEGKLNVLVKEEKSGREAQGTVEIKGILTREQRLVAQQRVTDIAVK